MAAFNIWHLVPSLLHSALYLTGFQALGAYPNPFWRTIHHDAYTLKVAQPLAPHFLVRMANSVTAGCLLVADDTLSGHR